MNNKISKLSSIVALLIEIILLISAIFIIKSKQWQDLTFLLLAIVLIIVPFTITHIANKKNIVLPSNFQLVCIVFILLTIYFGELKKFYIRFWWWDLFIHTIFGTYGVVIALSVAKGIFKKDETITKKKFVIFILIYAFSFSIALGTLWEVFEFLGDYFLKTHMIKGGLEDTLSDIIVKVISAYITCVIYYYKLIKHVEK